jgi:hypothetical protein
MKLLKAFEGLKENSFPRIALFNNLLVATTDRGLFICNTDDMKCHYVPYPPEVKRGTLSLTVLQDKVIAYGYGNWFIYAPKQGLTPARFDDKEAAVIRGKGATLAARSYHDTAFLFTNPNSCLYKLRCVGNEIKVCSITPFNSFINSVTVSSSGYMVNTVKYTVNSVNNHKIEGWNISSSAVDIAGRRWFGTLDHGVMTDAGTDQQVNQPLLIKSTNDQVQCIAKRVGVLFVGTSQGNLLQYDLKSKQTKVLCALPEKNSGITYLYVCPNQDIIVGSSINTYRYNAASHLLTAFEEVKTLKQVDTAKGRYIFATSKGLFFYPKARPLSDNMTASLISEKRCRSVAYVPLQHTIWASFKDGLFRVGADKRLFPMLYNGQPVYAACLATAGKLLVVGTFTNGIIIGDGERLRRISINNGLYSNCVTGVKIRGRHLWVLMSGAVQLFDLDTLEVIDSYNLPSRSDDFVRDIEEDGQTCYIITYRGLYAIQQSAGTAKFEPKISLMGMFINGDDTATVEPLQLNHTQNDILFKLGIPPMPKSDEIYIKYRLLSNTQNQWTYSNPGERNFHFASLMPGRYSFEAVAGYPQHGLVKHVYRFSFVINTAWWQSIWFLALVLVFTGVLVFLFIRLYYLNQLNIQKNNYEKELLIRSERQRISSEMHDDIGSGLAAIKLLSGEIKAGRISTSLNDGLTLLADMVSTLTETLREVIWSLDAENDELENLLFFIEAHCRQLFRHSAIQFSIFLPDHEAPDLQIDGTSRRNIYLIIKELLHNTIKHSGASNASLLIKLSPGQMVVTVSDDGIGYDVSSAIHKGTSMGLKNISQRVKQLNAQMVNNCHGGTTVTITIPLNIK